MTRARVIFDLAPLAVLFTMALPWPALAQSPPSDAPAASSAVDEAPSAPAPPAGRTDRKKGSKSGGKVVIDNPFDVTAREKPSAFFLFQRSTMDYDWARLDARFAPLVLESVQDPLF